MSEVLKQRPATYADIEALPPNMVGQIIFGVLHTRPRPRPRHGLALLSVGDELVGPFQKGRGGPGGWVFMDEPELHLGEHVLVPDLAGWRRERLLTLPETAYLTAAPDWVCEVLSPSTARLDRTEKLPIYGQFGVAHAWLVDPDARTLEVFASTARQWLLAATFKAGDTVAAVPFQVHAFDLDVLWGGY